MRVGIGVDQRVLLGRDARIEADDARRPAATLGSACTRRMKSASASTWSGRSGLEPSVVWKTSSTGESSPSPQCVLQQVEAAPRLHVGRQDRGVGRAELDAQEGQPQPDQHHQQRHQHRAPAGAITSAPAVSRSPPFAARAAAAASGPIESASIRVPEHAQQRRQQRQRRQHADGHHQRAGDAHRAQRRDVEGQQRQQPDHDRRAREQHRPARRRHRPRHRAFDDSPRAELLAEADDHEQRVVDAQAEAEHRGQVQREDRQLERTGRARPSAPA